MTDVHPSPSASKAEQEASEWIARLNADDATAEDRAHFEKWRRASPLNAQAFDDLSQTWNRFLQAGELARSDTYGDFAIPRRSYQRPRRWRVPLAAAAALILVAVATGLYMRWSTRPEIFQTAVGEQLTVNLPDDSVMELNSNSLARVDYRAHRRIIHLDRGEAFFKVVHNSGRPFRVSAPEGWVRDVGTQFDVYLRATNLRIIVSEGAVEVGDSGGSAATARPDGATAVVVTSGQQADLASGHTVKRTLSPEQLAEAIAWRSGTVYFEDSPLEDVVAQLNRYAVTQVVLEDGALRALRVGGTFQANPKGSASLLRMLERNFGVRERRDDGRVYLRGPLQK